MKKIFALIFVLHLLFVPFAHGLTITELEETLLGADSPQAVARATSIAMANLDLLEQLLTSTTDHHARLNAFSYLMWGSQNNYLTKKRFFDLAFNQLVNIASYAEPSSKQDELNIFSALMSRYLLSDNTSQSVFTNIEIILQAIDSMLANKAIKNSGVALSLKKKLTNAKAILEKKGNKGKLPAQNMVGSTINEIEAQADKHITKETSLILESFCNTLLTQIQSTTFP